MSLFQPPGGSSALTSVAGRTGDVVLTKIDVGLSNLDNTSDANKPISGVIQAALNSKAATSHTHVLSEITGLQANFDSKAPTVSPTFTGTVVGVTKAHVGLGNVNDTSDVDKPISSAVQLVLNAKAPLASPAFTGTPTGITKTHVGLPNVDNTADVSKPVSVAQQAAIDSKAAASHTHTTSDVNAGVMATARLGGGTATATTFLRGDQTWAIPAGSSGLGYTLPLVAGVINPVNDSEINYWGSFAAKSPDVIANRERVYIPKSGTIKGANVIMYQGTPGTAENISLHIGINNTTFTLVSTVGVSTTPRIFTNNSLSIPVVAGDYVAMRWTFPVWVTNPSATYCGGTIYIE